ncbi:MAG: ABC transporter substrate-binding protein [Methylophilaceae bacterium]|nr:ABC transporter substrate-binding protein [Methylophilaceae bacterium]
MALAQAPLNLDPRYATDAASERVNRLLYQSLVDFDEHEKPKPSLASWKAVSPVQYRFHLIKEGRVFHDGSRLTAADVVATYQSFNDLRDSPHKAEFANIRQIQALDADTIDFTLRQPDSGFPARLIIGILPAHLLAARHDFAHAPVGSGALKFIAWKNRLTLQRVSDRQIISLQEVKDPTVRVLKLLRGEVDLLQGDLPPELVAYLRRQSGIQVLTSQGANFSYLGFNLQDRQLQNPLVRRAIAHAIDRQTIIEKALTGSSRAASAILPPEHWAGNPDLMAYDYNPKLCRELLTQAGIKLPLKLSYKTSTDAQRVRLATIMQAQMQPAGIALEIRSLDWGTYFEDIKQGKFQLYGLTWVGIKTPEIYRLAFHSASLPPQGANRGHFLDSTLDKLIVQAENGEQDGWKKVTAYVHETLPYVPLWYEGQFVALRHEIKNYSPKVDSNWDDLAVVVK